MSGLQRKNIDISYNEISNEECIGYLHSNDYEKQREAIRQFTSKMSRGNSDILNNSALELKIEIIEELGKFGMNEDLDPSIHRELCSFFVKSKIITTKKPFSGQFGNILATYN